MGGLYDTHCPLEKPHDKQRRVQRQLSGPAIDGDGDGAAAAAAADDDDVVDADADAADDDEEEEQF